MKTLACLAISVLLALLGGLSAVSQAVGDTVFLFLSVRIKGNGDGTVTAVAQNEFAVGSCTFPVVLSLYSSETYVSNVERMEQEQTATSYDLNLFETLSITCAVAEERYFCAVVYYSLNGDLNKQQTDVIRYNTEGNRI